MDARKTRIGEHTAGHAPPWAITALGPVPEDPPARLDWQRRASSIGAWRELSGHKHPADPIGPEPAKSAPPPGTPAWPASAPPPKPTPPNVAATTTTLPRKPSWPPATKPCTTP